LQNNVKINSIYRFILQYVFLGGKLMVVGYIRVSTDKQDLQKQKHTILEYSNSNKILVDRFIEIEISSKKNQKDRRINELINLLDSGDELLTVELSRLGRNMLEVLNILESLSQKNVAVTFIRQPELSTSNKNPQSKLLLAIYSYFAEAERDFISQRTKSALNALRAKGIKLGRPAGTPNKESKLTKWHEMILEFLKMDLTIASIQKIISNKSQESVSYNTIKYYVKNDKELAPYFKKKAAA